MSATALAPEPAHGAPHRVVYLLGAGATQGAVTFAGSGEKLVMPGLIDRLLERMREEYIEAFQGHAGIGRLVNDIVNAQTDFEHLLTFLEDAPSGQHQEFAAQLKTVFETVLRTALDKVRRELGGRHSALFSALVDMHAVRDLPEALSGFLTLNYDSFLEDAIRRTGRPIAYGVRMNGHDDRYDAIPVLKLHGSFSWRHTWPIEVGEDLAEGLWIPPGIRKRKAEYPFNAIWGAARELLDCDVLRIIGCNLGPNDWDLVSLLFTTLHCRDEAASYHIEVVGRPETASRIATAFPYLDVRSILEIPEIGPAFIAEVVGGEPVEFSSLDDAQQERAREQAQSKISNPFEHWLRLKGELMLRDLPTIETDRGFFQEFVEQSG